MERVRESALLVEAPEAEEAVGVLRRRLDPHAADGVPAHLSALYPFVPPDRIDPGVLDEVRRVAATVPAFSYELTHTDWFGEEVLWLAPDPAENFRKLTQRLVEAFPDCPPYGGAFEVVVPHLTIGDRARPEDMRAAEAVVQARLPVRARASGVTLMVEEPSGRWQRAAQFPLRATS